jgi:hypothetical protein
MKQRWFQRKESVQIKAKSWEHIQGPRERLLQVAFLGYQAELRLLV